MKHIKIKSLALVGTLLFVLLSLGAPYSWAAVEEFSGAVAHIRPPPSVALKDYTSDTQTFVFEEQSLTLAQDLAVDISQAGNYADLADLTPGLIPAGTPVCSHLVHFDLNPGTTGVNLSGTVRFDTPILGLLVTDAGLDNTDATFGVTTYPAPGLVYRGLDFGDDQVIVGSYILSLDLFAHQVMDQMRVLTYCPDPPLTWGDMVDTGGALVPVKPPPSVQLKAYTSQVEIRAFNENTLTLAQDLAVDITLPGTYNDPNALSPGLIPAGTRVTSHLLHFDLPPGVMGVTLSGSISFDQPILGLIVVDGSLDATDATLGAPGTIYPTPGITYRGLELGLASLGDDELVVGSHTLEVVNVNLTAFNIFDHVRILTAEPVTLTVRDEFKAIAYDGNDGTADWSGDWMELGETNGPGRGRVRIVNSRACPTPNCLRIGGDEVNLRGRGLMRGADMSGASSATLSFSYRRYPLDDDEGGSVRLQVSADGGANWTTLASYRLDRRDRDLTSERFDISAYAGPDTQIRFLGAGDEVEGYLFIDDVQIKYTIGGDGGTVPAPKPTPTPTPSWRDRDDDDDERDD
jgi:hypothetical protein